VAIPVGQLAFGPLGSAYGYHDVLIASGILYAAVCLITQTSASVRGLRRAPAAQVAAAG
jgi:hypothetical protein